MTWESFVSFFSETGEMKALLFCLTILECLNVYSKWFGAV